MRWTLLILILDFILTDARLWQPKGIKEVRWFTSRQCQNSQRHNGTCISLPACYPNHQLPQLSGWSQFISGKYESCGYITPQGQPFVGACCTALPPVTISTETPTTTTTQEPATVGHDSVRLLLPIPKPSPNHFPTGWPRPSYPTYPPIAPALPWFTVTRPPRFAVQTTTTFRPWWIPIFDRFKTTSTTNNRAPVEIPIECGKRNNSFRVVGGQKAGYWPWMAGLLGRRGLFCGGTLLTNYHILTAAHCVTGLSPADITVRLGDLDLTNTTDRDHVDVRVSSIVVNPSYNLRTNQQDVAILRLQSKVAFNADISPICLPKDSSRNYAGHKAIVVGWGATRLRGPTSKVLMELNVRVWSVSECQTKFQPNFPNQIVHSNICAGDGGRDACSGDSGGPLMENDDGTYTQVGIVSWGVGCGAYRYPGVYTRVTSFINWIKSHLN